MQKTFLLMAVAVSLTACRNERGAPAPDGRVQTERGTPGATPNQQFTTTNSNQGTSVPREGGNLDRGVTKSNDPLRNAPGTKGQALDASGTGTGKDTR
jgi:hypothetical protein